MVRRPCRNAPCARSYTDQYLGRLDSLMLVLVLPAVVYFRYLSAGVGDDFTLVWN